MRIGTTSILEIKEEISEIELSRDDDDELVAENVDTEDKDEDKEDTVNPSYPDDSDNGNNGSDESNSGDAATNKKKDSNVRTGDTQNIIIWFIPLAAAAIVVAILIRHYRKRMK